jgi:hypothetical protein
VTAPLPTRGPHCPPALSLEAHFAGEPNARVAAHVPQCDACRAYVAALAQEQAAFKVRYPTDALVARHPAPKAARSLFPWWVFAGAAVAAAAAVVVVAVRPPREDVTLKGGAWRVLVQSGASAPVPLQPGATLHAGDAVRFTFTAPADGFVAVLDRDERGASVVAPMNGATSLAVKAGAPVALPDSVVLDDATGAEAFVLVFDAAPFELAPLVDQLRARPVAEAGLRCGACQVEVVRFEKAR